MLRRTSLCLIAFTLMLSAAAWAQEPAKPLRPDEEMHRPRIIPDRVTLTCTTDPATSQAVSWRTDASVKSGAAQIMLAIDGPDTSAEVKEIKAVTTEFVTKFWTVNYHAVEFKDLKPNTIYAYRVGGSGNWSEWFQFKTANNKPEPFTFIYFGDVQGGVRVLWPRVLREAYKTAPDARFFAFAGDLVEDGNTERYWGEFFTAGDWLYATVPMLPTVGNHDYRGPAPDTYWRTQFVLPDHAPEGLKEYAYYVDYQGLRMISLNSMERGPEQTKWLESVLSNNPNKWTIVLFHYPVFTNVDGPNREDLVPIFNKYKVDMVFTGNDHTYSRSGLTDSTVYIVSVVGSKMYDIKRKDWMRRVAEDTQLFQVIRIDGDKLTYESRTATGTLYDAFELQKQAGKSNKFIEKIPAGVPERLRKKAPAAGK